MRDRSSAQARAGTRDASARRRAQHRRREGNVAITVVLLLGVIFGMVALSVDAGQLYKVRTEAQNAADATALRAAVELDGTEDGIDAARAAAVDFAQHNRIYGGDAVVDEEDVTFGRWSPSTGVFTELDETEVTEINAVRVLTSDTEVDNPFASALGRPETDVNAAAIATGGGVASECSFPMVVADCAGDFSLSNCGMCFKFQDDNSDTAGWSGLDTSDSNGTGTFANLIKSGCSNLIPGCSGFNASDVDCDGACTSTIVDNEVKVHGGNSMNEGGASYDDGDCADTLNNPCEVLKQILLRENTDETDKALESDGTVHQIDGQDALAGKYFSTRVPLIENTDPSACNPKFAGNKRIVGYATIDIFEVQCQNAGGGSGNGNGNGNTASAEGPVSSTALALSSTSHGGGDGSGTGSGSGWDPGALAQANGQGNSAGNSAGGNSGGSTSGGSTTGSTSGGSTTGSTTGDGSTTGSGSGSGSGSNRAGVIDMDYYEAHESELAALDCDPPSGKHILGRLRCEEFTGPGGGGVIGAGASRPRLVQ